MRLDPAPTVVELVKDNMQANNIWTTWLSSLFEWLNSANGSKVPTMTTAERDALDAENGMIVFNETTNVFNFYENGAWVTK